MFAYRRLTLFFFFLLTFSLARPSLAHEGIAILPIPEPLFEDVEKEKLGNHLFHDPVFAQDGTLSCASCHSLKKEGIDGLARYAGMNGKTGLVNTPTVFNASLSFSYFWDGRVQTLEDVIEDHVKDETIFANTWPKVIKKIQDNNSYQIAFQTIYQEGVTPHTIKNALVSFLNTLLTPASPFDQFLKGNTKALSEEEKRGYQLFLEYGCVTCHQGPNMGGNLLQPLGIYKDYFGPLPNKTVADLGYFNVTHKEKDKYVFKVPSLRNVALTPPYLHDGSIQTLEEVIKIMGVYQVGQAIPDYQIPYLVKFLGTLSSPLPDAVLNEK